MSNIIRRSFFGSLAALVGLFVPRARASVVKRSIPDRNESNMSVYPLLLHSLTYNGIYVDIKGISSSFDSSEFCKKGYVRIDFVGLVLSGPKNTRELENKMITPREMMIYSFGGRKSSSMDVYPKSLIFLDFIYIGNDYDIKNGWIPYIKASYYTKDSELLGPVYMRSFRDAR